MFETKKQLKEKIKNLEWDIEGLKISKDITISVAENETRNAKAVADYWRTRFENVEKIIKENEILEEKIKTLNDTIKNAELNFIIKENEKCKLMKSMVEKNIEIRKLKDKNTELQGNVVSLVAQNQELEKKIQKYYEYEKSFRKQLKEKDAEISSLKTQNEIQRAVIEDAWDDNVIIEEEKTITFYTQEGEKTYPLIFKK